MRIYNFNQPGIVYGRPKVSPSVYGRKNTPSFWGVHTSPEEPKNSNNPRNNISRPYYNKYVTAETLKNLEGLQEGLKSFEGLNIEQIYAILHMIREDGLFFPVVRGCYHNCAHCYLDAKAPIERMDYEDFHNLLSDISKMYKRFGMYSRNRHSSTLFWDSDCSETYLLDKNGKVHDLTDLTKEFYTILELSSHVDTAGWNPKSKEIQKRMERFVEYCSNNPEFLKKAITRINLSINPFHSLQTTALKQKQKGNVENYNKLHQKYLDMVANMINTFAPLIEHPKIGFICRVYPDLMDYPELDGFRTKNMIELKTEIIEHFKSKYPETIEKYPKITDILENKIIPEDDFITKGGRDNQFKQFSRTWIKLRPSKELKSNEDLIKRAFLVSRAYIDLNGDFYMINDYESYKTNLRLNIGKDTNKPMRPPVHSQIVEI